MELADAHHASTLSQACPPVSQSLYSVTNFRLFVALHMRTFLKNQATQLREANSMRAGMDCLI